MKKLLSFILLSLLFISCGKEEDEKNSSSSSYKYSFCGSVESLNNNLKINTSNGSYNLSYQGSNQNLINQLYQYANTNQQTCVYTNIDPQTNGSNGGYTGYALPTIVVQSLSNGSVSSAGNYPVQLCGMVYKAYSYGGTHDQTRYVIQVTDQSKTGAVAHYQIQSNSNTVVNLLNQMSSQQRNGCVYSNQQPMQSGYTQIVIAEQVVWQ
jgi:hypothetical protein